MNRLPFAVVVVIKQSQNREFDAWLRECLQGPYQTRPPTLVYGWPGAYTGALDIRYVVACRFKSDAVLTKLTWALL